MQQGKRDDAHHHQQQNILECASNKEPRHEPVQVGGACEVVRCERVRVGGACEVVRCERVRVGGACGPPPPVAAPLAGSLRAPFRGDPPRGALRALLPLVPVEGRAFIDPLRAAVATGMCSMRCLAPAGHPQGRHGSPCRIRAQPCRTCRGGSTYHVALDGTRGNKARSAPRGGSPRKGARSEPASGAATGGGGPQAPPTRTRSQRITSPPTRTRSRRITSQAPPTRTRSQRTTSQASPTRTSSRPTRTGS